MRDAALDAFASHRDAAGSASVLGLHLEGPVLSSAARGAHPLEHLLAPAACDTSRWRPEHGVRLVTVAPELPGARALVAQLAVRRCRRGARPLRRRRRDFLAGFDAGAVMCTHLFNAMRPFHHRDPGPVGAVLATPDRSGPVAGLICDGHHVDPVAVAMAWRALAPWASRAGDRRGRDAWDDDRTATHADRGARRQRRHARCRRAQPRRMDRCVGRRSDRGASRRRRRACSASPTAGVIEPGAVADLVVLDDRLEIGVGAWSAASACAEAERSARAASTAAREPKDTALASVECVVPPSAYSTGPGGPDRRTHSSTGTSLCSETGRRYRRHIGGPSRRPRPERLRRGLVAWSTWRQRHGGGAVEGVRACSGTRCRSVARARRDRRIGRGDRWGRDRRRPPAPCTPTVRTSVRRGWSRSATRRSPARPAAGQATRTSRRRTSTRAPTRTPTTQPEPARRSPGCHRSKAAEAHIGGGVNSLNLACSGARTYTQAGSPFKPGLDWYDGAAGKSQVVQLEGVRHRPQRRGRHRADRSQQLRLRRHRAAVRHELAHVAVVVEELLLRRLVDQQPIHRSGGRGAHERGRRRDRATSRSRWRRPATHATDWKLIVQTYWSPLPPAANIRYARVRLDAPERRRVRRLEPRRRLGQQHGRRQDEPGADQRRRAQRGRRLRAARHVGGAERPPAVRARRRPARGEGADQLDPPGRGRPHRVGQARSAPSPPSSGRTSCRRACTPATGASSRCATACARPTTAATPTAAGAPAPGARTPRASRT